MFDVNDLMQHIIISVEFCQQLDRHVQEDADILENQVTNTAKASVLLQFVKQVKADFSLLSILESVLMYSIDANSITECVYEEIKSFPKAERQTLLIALAHNKISLYQLEEINRMNICTEAFCQLLSAYMSYDCFSAVDVKKLISKSRISHYALNRILKEYIITTDKTEKASIIQDYLKSDNTTRRDGSAVLMECQGDG